MVIGGQWTLHYDWGCSGIYVQVGITADNDGKFNIPTQKLTGKWVQNDGMILFQFDNNKVTYGGNFAGNAIVGMMSTFEGLNGCWYAIREGSTIAKAGECKPEFDASGYKTEK
jgi:hypothetical protein